VSVSAFPPSTILADGSYRIALWTRDAPDTSLPETDPLMKRILTIGRYFKVTVLGYAEEQKLVTGGYQTELTFESHKDSEKKGNKVSWRE
jgi:translation initiation factor 4E